MSVLILYYSMYGHIYQLAKEVVEGVKETGAKAVLKRVPETLPEAVLQKMGALEFQNTQKSIPVCEDVMELADYDAIIFGTPTRFGNMCGQMRQFLDATGKLWMKNALVGKVGSVFSSSSTQHGGQESTILSFHITLLHQGMVIAGLPYTFAGQSSIDEITGCSPYGASTIAGPKGDRNPSEIEKNGARFQGKYVAGLALKISAK